MELQEYIDGVKSTIEGWLQTHDRESFFEQWVAECGLTFEKLMELEGNDYLITSANNAKDKLYAQVAREWHIDGDTLACPFCNFVTNEETCDNCGGETERATLEQIDGYLRDNGLDYNVNEYIFERWITEDVYDEFVKLLPSLPSLIQEAKECLHSLEYDDDIITAVAWANHLLHCGGNLLQDHAHISSEIINAVAEDGLVAVFGEDAIAEYTA